jgi:RimJ/RimL family protein N-acetyltransferase
VKNKNIALRYIMESDMADYVKWTTTEVEWCEWDAPWENDDPWDDFMNWQKSLIGKRPERYAKLEIDTLDAPGAPGKHIGWVSSYFADDEETKTTVGIDIPAPACRRKGYGENALTLFMAYLCEVADVLYTQTWSGNSPMIGLAKKIGFVEVEREKDLREVNGQQYDALTFAITKADFFDRYPGLITC